MDRVDKFFAEIKQRNQELKQKKPFNTNKMKIIKETKKYIIYTDYFNDKPVRFIKDKVTGEIRMDANDWARSFGYENLDALLETDDGLDVISKWKTQNPDGAFLGELSSGAMFEEIDYQQIDE